MGSRLRRERPEEEKRERKRRRETGRKMLGEGGRCGEGWEDTGAEQRETLINSFKELSLCPSPLAVSHTSLCSLGYSHPASFLQNNITKGKKTIMS